MAREGAEVPEGSAWQASVGPARVSLREPVPYVTAKLALEVYRSKLAHVFDVIDETAS